VVAEADGDGVALADGSVVDDGDTEALADGVAVADADPVATPGAATDARLVGLAAGFVGVRVGRGLDAVADGCAAAGVAGAVPGGSASPPFCQEKATVAPAGTLSEVTATLEYFQPDVPSDQ
jgi:hypothetical protein